LRKLNISVENAHWPLLINFAIKKEKLDYQFLLDIYRDRVARMALPS